PAQGSSFLCEQTQATARPVSAISPLRFRTENLCRTANGWNFLEFPSGEESDKALSGGQKGPRAPSVPGSGCSSVESRERRYIWLFPSRAKDMSSRRPSGEISRNPRTLFLGSGMES